MPDIMGIFDHARKFMRENGNPYQWTDGYPSEELMETEIRQGHCFVCENETDGVVATFCFSVGNDPTYSHIEGKWLNEAPYGVIHRLASNGKAKGIARQCIAWCFARHHNLRADTHADNLIMQNLLKTNGFRSAASFIPVSHRASLIKRSRMPLHPDSKHNAAYPRFRFF